MARNNSGSMRANEADREKVCGWEKEGNAGQKHSRKNTANRKLQTQSRLHKKSEGIQTQRQTLTMCG